GLVFLSGQIPLDPQSMEVVAGGIEVQIKQVFDNLSAVCTAAGGTLDDILKLTVFLTDMSDFPQVNSIMGEYFNAPYPARAAVQVAALPKGVNVEMDAILAA
ncbi:Rid family detoxifying hydrolase, partial [Pseudomonadota bacterium]